MTDLLIAAKAINTYYGASHILRGIDFCVARGETIGLMGRNGMGKSTLLKSIMGLVKPRTGAVSIMGKTMTGRAPFEVARLGIAYVPEGRGIFGNLSVKENLVMAAREGASEAARERARQNHDWTYERVLDTFPRLKERLGHGGQQLSGGEQRQLEIAMTLATEPQVLLLDEPLAGMGIAEAERMVALLLTIKKDHGILLVEHDMDAVFALADQLTVMVNGQVIASGTPLEIRADAGVQAAYLGEEH